MYKAKITNIEKVRHQATGVDFLDVTVDVIEVVEGNEDVVVSTQKHALDIATTKEALLETVEKIRAGYQQEQDQKLANAADEAVNAHVSELQAELVGSEVEAENNDQK